MTTVAFIMNKSNIAIGCDLQITDIDMKTNKQTGYCHSDVKFIRTGYGFIGAAGSAYGNAIIFNYFSKKGAELKSDLIYSKKDVFTHLSLNTDIKELEEVAKFDLDLISASIEGFYSNKSKQYMGNYLFYVDQKRIIIGDINSDFKCKIIYAQFVPSNGSTWLAIGSGSEYAKQKLAYLDDHLPSNIGNSEIMRRALQCSNTFDLGTGNKFKIQRLYFKDMKDCIKENVNFDNLEIALKRIKDRKSMNKLTFSFIRLHRMVADCFGIEFYQKWLKISCNLIFKIPNLIFFNPFLTNLMLFYKYKKRDHYGGIYE